MRTHLVVLVVGALLPVVIFSVLMVFRDAAHHTAAVRDDLVDRARALSLALDREIGSSVIALESLAASEHLDADDVGAFYRECERARGMHPSWLTVALVERGGRHVFSLLRPFGTVLPPTPIPETIAHILKTGRPWVSDLHTAPISGRPALTVGVPVGRQGTIRYVLTAAVGPATLAEIVARQSLPADWIVTVLDRGHVVIARTRDAERHVGAASTAPWVARITAPEGSFATNAVEGQAVYLGYARSPHLRWTVVLAVPASIVNTPSWSSLQTLGGGAVAVTLLGILCALILGRRIDSGLTALSSSAQGLGRNEMVVDVTERKRAEDAAQALAEIAGEIAGPLDLPRVADRIVSVVLRTLHADRATLFELDAGSGDLVCLAAAGDAVRDRWVGQTLAAGAGTVGRVLTEGRPIWLADVIVTDPALRNPPWVLEELGDSRYSSFAAPLTVQGQIIGVLGFTGEAGREATADDLDLLSALAHLAAVALQNARLYRDQALRARRLHVLSRLNQLISSSLDADETLGAITRAAGELLEAPYAAIWLIDEAKALVERQVASTDPYPVGQQRFGDGLVEWAAKHRCVVNVPDGTADPRTLRPDWFEAVGVRSFLAVPIVHDESLLGILALARRHPFVLEPATGELLGSFVAQSAVAIRNAQLFAEAQRRRRQAETLAVLARTIGATLDLDTVLQQAVEVTRDLLESDRAQIALRDPDADVMIVRYRAPRPLGRELGGLGVEKGKGLGGLAWMLGRPVRTVNYAEDSRLTHEHDPVIREVGLIAVLAVPIVIADEVEGLLYVSNRAPRPFSEHDEAVLVDLALHAAIAIQNARLFARVQSASDRLALLSRRLLEVQETERRYLARELHDEIGQLLTGLSLMLDRCRRLPVAASLACVSEAQALTTELLMRVRNLSLDLRPAMLDDLGLLPALLWHFERYTVSTGVHVAFKQSGLEGRRFSAEIESAAYRIVQEALTNVARHSGAPEATVDIDAADGVLRLQIEDQGVGFDPEAVSKDAGSSGLIGVRERARLSHGRVTVTSACGLGTRLTVELPTADAPERTPRSLSGDPRSLSGDPRSHASGDPRSHASGDPRSRASRDEGVSPRTGPRAT